MRQDSYGPDMTGTPSETFILTAENIALAMASLEQEPDGPDGVVLKLTTRQARTIHMMPGTLICEARKRPVKWRGDWIRVTTEC